MKISIILLYTVLSLFAQVSFAQYYDTGQDPASLKWMQIKTSRFTVIYPESYGPGGVEFAKSLDEAYSRLLYLYPDKKFKIPVIIHNFTTQSNGYVAWAPRRMELYPTPEQNTIPLRNETQLAVHELAHVFQMKSLYTGFSKGMSLFFGEQFTGVVAALLPLWFLEGDAVFAESTLTESGRGRSPSFQKQLKAIALEPGRVFKYDKILNGSYRDFIPDHYQSGFQMVTWARTKYDPRIWNDALKYTGDQPFTINPVNISLRRSAGLTKKKLYNEAFDSLKVIWTKELAGRNARSYETISPDKKGKYINYYSPVFAGNDSIIAIKTSLSKPAEFVLVKPSSGTEKKLHVPGQVYPWFLSYAKGKIVWVETQVDPRWENRNYSVIKLMDLRNNNKITKLSGKSRYLSASVSPDGRKIAAVENTVSNKNSIVFIDASTGAVLQSVAAPENVYLQRPQWSEKGEKITVIFLTDEGEGIMSFSPANQKWDILIEAGREDIQSAILRNDSLFYISSKSGTDNVYLKTPANKTTELTSSKFGTVDLSINMNKFIFSDYTSTGNSICISSLRDSPKKTYETSASGSFLINRAKSDPKLNVNSLTGVYTPVPYRKWQHLFRFHSWLPFYADIEQIKADPTAIRPGISLMTQNNLSTLISSVGYEYSADKKNVLHTRITWNGWYPVFESQLDYGNAPLIYKSESGLANPSDIQPGMRFLNTVSIPLRFSSGRFSEYLRPSISSDYRNEYIYIKEEGSYDYGQTILSGRLYFSNIHKYAFRDIYPRWAQIIDLNYSYAPFDRNIYGSEATMKTAFYVPGFFPNNGIKFRYERESQDPSKFMFGNKVPFPRSYKNIISKKLELISVDYVLPLAYPDFNVASFLYLTRIRTGLFYDYAAGTDNSYFTYTANGVVRTDHIGRETFRSFGIELLTDFYLFRIPYMISGGVQAAWKNLNESPSLELLFNIDLYGMSIGRRER
jgi:hypothetical protein